MKEPKHTPGPWHFAEPFRILKAGKDRCELHFRGIGNGVSHVGYASICAIHSNGEALANARLMAAAPELLDACRASVARDPSNWEEIARAAIAKATKPS